ncbi:UNVERIFIED_CONTAM: Ribosomal RNA small subunit methyltransferase I [Sesamum radiatum]|uniref:Ribosomal RNA small subunit methyltransferase I n=1 Tax=Sesamum radiatum TaxID=300843 RepID=A0AAW2PYT4_SESRA
MLFRRCLAIAPPFSTLRRHSYGGRGLVPAAPPLYFHPAFSGIVDFLGHDFCEGPLKPGLYLVGTPIGNLEDITLRALRVLKSADVILSEDTRHSGKLLQYYNIRTPLLSYHKFNESQREQVVLRRLQSGEIVALISDAGMPGISDPGMELAKLCVEKNIPVIPVPGPSALVAALSASGLPTNEFTFVGFLPKHAASRRERLMVSANNPTTQVFFVPPHKLCQFLEETCSIFGQSRRCVIAREMTKLHEEFWRGTIGEAKEAFTAHPPRGEITLLIEGVKVSEVETFSESQLENELGELISKGHSLSMKDWNPDMMFDVIEL